MVVLGACQLLLLYFCCCAARPDDEEYTVTITPYPAPGANTISIQPASSAVYGSAGHGVLRLRQGASGTPVSAPGASGHVYGGPLMMTAVVGQPVAAQVAEGRPAEVRVLRW